MTDDNMILKCRERRQVLRFRARARTLSGSSTCGNHYWSRLF